MEKFDKADYAHIENPTVKSKDGEKKKGVKSVLNKAL